MGAANQQAQVVCPDGGMPNALGNCRTIQPTDNSTNYDPPVDPPVNPPVDPPVNPPADPPTDSSSEQTCAEQGLVQCATGGCASTPEECESIFDEYNKTMNITVEGQFIDDPDTEDHNEAMHDIYLAIGGMGWTGLAYQDWLTQYGDEFPEWEGSMEQKQHLLIQSQMGLLGAETENVEEVFKLGGEEMRFKSSAELEAIGQAREDIMRKGGGLQSGQREEKMESAYDAVLKGFDFDARSQELSYEQDLIGLEGRKLGYELDLHEVVSDFQDNMWDLISVKQEMQKGVDFVCTTDSDCDGCMKCNAAGNCYTPSDCNTAETFIPGGGEADGYETNLCATSPECCTDGVKDCDKCPETCGEEESGGTGDAGQCADTECGPNQYPAPQDDGSCICYDSYPTGF